MVIGVEGSWQAPTWELSWWTVLRSAATILAIAHVPSVLSRRRGRPVAALAWILTLVSLPYFGVVLWWAVGRDHLARKRRRKIQAAAELAASLDRVRRAMEVEGCDFPLRAVPSRLVDSVFPPTDGNRARLLVDAAEAYPAMEEAIRAARDSVHFQYYIWQPDETGRRFRDLLIEKARAGVRVRALYDAIGSLRTRQGFLQPLQAAGAGVAAFLPPRFGLLQLATLNFRNHRKILVVDGRTGFTGGLNVGDEHLTGWRDVAVHVEGPAVAQLQEVFVEDWFFATGEDLATTSSFGEAAAAPRERAAERRGARDSDGVRIGVIASGPDNAPDNPTRDAFFVAVTSARRDIRIMTPYFVPDEALLTALRTAGLRGVDARVLVPSRNDVALVRLASRSFYPDLLAAGVRIFEYQPGMVHAKMLIVDDALCAVGSANMDNRSFRLNFEVTAFLSGREFASHAIELFDSDLTQCRQVTSRHLAARSRWSTYVDSAAHLLSPLL